MKLPWFGVEKTEPKVTISPCKAFPRNGGVPIPFQIKASNPPETSTLKTVVASNPVFIILGTIVTSSSIEFEFSYQTLLLASRMTLYLP